MTKFSIEYNPYRVECIFKKNGKVLGRNCRLGAKKNERFQVLLIDPPEEKCEEECKEGRNWEGFGEEIRKECNDSEIEITFRGRRIDYDDLVYYMERYTGNVKFLLKFEEAKNDNDMLQELDTLFAEIKEKNIPQFNVENAEGKNIFDVYEEVKNGIFEVSVIATMSSGKSTLINSLLHTELLPSENKACTATITRIIDNDEMDTYEAECYAADNETVVHKRAEVNAEILKEYNADSKVIYIDIEGSVPAISSDKIRLCLRDTPGPNNSRDENHGKLTSSIIKRTNAVVLYVINATQIGINDDKQLLLDISNEMKRAGKQSRDRFIFVVNKCDVLDEEKGETLDSVLAVIRGYLKDLGIEEPTIIPTSARIALLVRKSQKGEKLTRMERNELASVDDFVNNELLHFEKYATLTPTVQELLQKRVEEYHQDEETWDMEAVIHSGVPALEETIIEYIEKYAYPMKIKDAVKDMEDILDDLNMKAKFEESIAEDTEQLEKVRGQIKEAREKQNGSKEVYDKYKEWISNVSLGMNKDEEVFQIEFEMAKITKKYNGKTKVDKMEADRLINSFQTELEGFQENVAARLNRELDENFYHHCEFMLSEYTRIVSEILDDIAIDGYDFDKTSELKKIKINNIEDIKKKNESERYRNEKRWKDNPERAGFFGWFKFWIDKKVSYTVQVKDGIDVNVDRVIGDILFEFKISMKNNIAELFDKAEEQMFEYIEMFKENINTLDEKIESIILDLEEKTVEQDAIKKHVMETKEISNWVANMEQKVEKLLLF